jgi:hypothetical protein
MTHGVIYWQMMDQMICVGLIKSLRTIKWIPWMQNTGPCVMNQACRALCSAFSSFSNNAY